MDRSSQLNRSNVMDKNGSRSAKVFACDFDGCGKRFTRLEHLNRHALNHTAGDATCPRCRAHFKRPDLLARHMERHRQRDEEAGGHGILKTRKRSWKHADGTIGDKRPNTSQNLTPEARSRSIEPANPDSIQDFSGPISPPISQESSEQTQQSQDLQGSHGEFVIDIDQSEDLSPSIQLFSAPHLAFTENAGGSFWNSGLDPQGLQTAVDFPYDDVFQPDTASSFNMPYTTATNYSWLFDLNANFDTNILETAQESSDCQMSFQNLDNHTGLFSGTSNQTFPHTIDFSQTAITPDFGRKGEVIDHTSDTHMFGSAHALAQSLSHESTHDSTHRDASEQHITSPATTTYTTDPSNDETGLQPIVPHFHFNFLERPLSTLIQPSSLPCIDECTREEILNLIDSLHPASPDDDPYTREDKSLTLLTLQTYLDLFFTRFNTAYPLIHRPTFVASEVNTLLLLAMLLLGATYSNKGAHQLAVCIHDVMRPAIFSHAGFSSRPELWVLQTILLVECFGKSRAGQKQHDMSHLFHGLLINLIRRSDCQTAQPIGPDEADKSPEDLEMVWRQWAEAEEKKRLALLCFLWDTQHAVLFCQSLCMSSFELRLSLPCSQSLWEAQNAMDWKTHAVGYTKEPQFLTALKSYLTQATPSLPHLNSLSRVLILHGLMSIFWDMQRRDQTSLGVVPGENGTGLRTWRDRISKAYDLWKTDFDAHCTVVSSHLKQNGSENHTSKREQQEFATFATSYNAVYHAAQVLLNADFLDLQIYAGARHILGKPVQRLDYVRSETVVKRWATAEKPEPSSPCAAKAAWHAAAILRDTSRQLEDFDAMGLFHMPWCLYLATLTCWAFHHSAPVRGGSANSDSEMVWDAKAEMDALIARMADSDSPEMLLMKQGSEKTGGLVWIMANVLERVRWGIIHASVLVLRGLVPWRLINQYQSI